MEHSKFNTDVSHLTYITNETIVEETGDYYPVFYNVFALLAQTLYSTQTEREDLSLTCMIHYYLWLEGRGYFFL